MSRPRNRLLKRLSDALNPTKKQSKINTLPPRKQPSSTIEAGSIGNKGYIAQTETILRILFPDSDEIILMDGEESQARQPENELRSGDSSPAESGEFAPPHEKVRTFPATPGVYLMKDAQGRVIYVGKAVNLRSRAGSYFTKAAEVEFRTAKLIPEIADIDYIDADSEVDALLIEARLIKDIQPRFNAQLKDDKTFPYLQITTREDFPRVEFTRTAGNVRCQTLRPVHECRTTCVARSPCCSGFFGFAPARWTSPKTTNAGAGFDRACWPVSINAQLPATCESAKKTIANDIRRLQDFSGWRQGQSAQRNGSGHAVGIKRTEV